MMTRSSIFTAAFLVFIPSLNGAADSPTQASAPLPAPALKLSLREAKDLALRNNPEITAAQMTTDAVTQQIRRVRSTFFPQIYGEVEAVYAPEGTRLTALGGLNNPTIFSRQSDGVVINQLLTDFGETYEQTAAARSLSNAANERTRAAQELVILEVARAYFEVLQSEEILRVAKDAVHARQLVFDRITLLMHSKMKSELDASFAEVNLNEGKLLVIEAENSFQEAEATLSSVLGFRGSMHFALSDEPLKVELPSSDQVLLRQALEQRHDVLALRASVAAAHRLVEAAVSAEFPKISATASGAVNPLYEASGLKHDDYGVGITMEIPLSDGGLRDSSRREARATEDAAEARVVDAENVLARDVRSAWLNAKTAQQRIEVTTQLTKNATLSENLAEARYRLGISSIVELSQAELNLTQTELQAASAKYEFQKGLALLDFTVGRDGMVSRLGCSPSQQQP